MAIDERKFREGLSRIEEALHQAEEDAKHFCGPICEFAAITGEKACPFPCMWGVADGRPEHFDGCLDPICSYHKECWLSGIAAVAPEDVVKQMVVEPLVHTNEHIIL